MTNTECRLACRGAVPVLVLLLSSALGCHTPKQSAVKPTIDARWQVQQGQANWSPGRGQPELAGELLLASVSSNRVLVEFTKPPLTLVVALRDPEGWSVEYPGVKKRVSGSGRPPSRFLWLHLPHALSGEALPADLRFELRPGGAWRLENARTGEKFRGYLSP